MPIGRIGQEFIVNTTATGDQFLPIVTALTGGRFVVTWYSTDPGDGSGSCIRRRRRVGALTAVRAAPTWPAASLHRGSKMAQRSTTSGKEPS